MSPMMPAQSARSATLDTSIDTHDNLHPTWTELAMPWLSSSLLHAGIVLIGAFIMFAVTAPRTTGENDRVVIPTVTDDMKSTILDGPSEDNIRKPTLPTQNEIAHDKTGGVDTRGSLNGAAGVLSSLGNHGENELFAIARGGGAKGDPRGTRIGDGTLGLIAPHGRPEGTIIPAPPKGMNRIVYLLDHSGSMLDSFDFLREEIKTRLTEMNAMHQIGLIMFSEDTNMVIGPKLTRATNDTKRSAQAALNKISAAGKNDDEFDVFAKGFDQAFAMNPQAVIFLTDGNFDSRLVEHVAKLNKDKKVVVQTIAFVRISPDAEANLKKISQDSGGRYKFVSQKDLH